MRARVFLHAPETLSARAATLALALTFALAPAAARAQGQTQPKIGPDFGTGHIVDLGHPLTESDPTFSGEKLYTRTATATIAKDGYTGGRITVDEHFGTHFDAPAHFGGEWTVDKVPVEWLVWRPAVCINIEPRVRTNEDYRLTLAEIKAFEGTHGPIPAGAVVFVATGWDRRWTDPARYRNERDGVKHFPGLSVEAATYLAKDRKVAGIGIDTMSVDYGPSTAFEVHKITMPANVYHIENAANLTSLPPRGFTVTVAPIDIAGGSGGPTRVFARLP
jgi:kynurenine formamidase